MKMKYRNVFSTVCNTHKYVSKRGLIRFRKEDEVCMLCPLVLEVYTHSDIEKGTTRNCWKK